MHKVTQKKKIDKPQPVYLSKSGLSRIISNRLGGIITGQGNSSAIANFASFDPVNGSFTFKGSIAIGKNDDATAINPPEKPKSFLTFKIEGDLISDSYASLFQNTKLNTNTLIDAQLHTLVKFKAKYFGSDRVTLQLARSLILNDYDAAVNKLFAEEKERKNYLLSKMSQLEIIKDSLKYYRNKYWDSAKEQQTALNSGNIADIKRLMEITNPLNKSIRKNEDDSVTICRQIDSVNLTIKNSLLLRQKAKEKLNQDKSMKLIILESDAPLTELRIGWFTVTGGVSKKNYYTYTPGNIFSEQIQKSELGTFRAGLSWNYYCEDKFPVNFSWLFNIGFLRYKDNNTSLLSTQGISQDVVVKNTAGDTVRKITKSYKVYTDPISETQAWNLSSNLYLISGSKTAALHLFPSYDINDGGKSFLNLGIGIVMAFKNSKKDQPVINAEGYIQFLDMLNKLDSQKKLLNRNEIGIRFGIPFNFF